MQNLRQPLYLECVSVYKKVQNIIHISEAWKGKIMFKKIFAIVIAMVLLTQTAVFADDATVTRGSIAGKTVNLVYVNMVPGRVGETGLANNSVVSTEPVGNIIKKQAAKRKKLLASVNGGYFNAYFKGDGKQFPDNCPKIYATVLEDGALINGGGNSKLPTIGFTKDGTAIMDKVALTPYVNVNGERAFSTWGVNSFFKDASAIMHFTDEMTLTVPLTSDMKMAVIENGVVTSVSEGHSINLTQGMDVLAFCSNAYAQPPSVGSKVTFTVERTPNRTEDQEIWDRVVSAVSVGPMLVNNGQNVSRDNPTFTEQNQQPDTVTLKGFIGVMKDGRVVMGTVTASNVNLANYLVSIGCADAMCLDGGASTMLYTPQKGFINSGGRNFANILSIVDKYDVAKEPEKPKAENIYDNTEEPDLSFDTSSLLSIKDKDSAVNLVSNVVMGMSANEKISVKAKDQLAYLAEEAAARSAALVIDDDIRINDGTTTIDATVRSDVKDEIASTLSNNNVNIRNIREKARIETTKNDVVLIGKEYMSSNLDVVEAVTPFAALEFDPEDVADLRIEKTGTNKVRVNFNQKESTKKVTIKFPGITDDNYKAIVDDNGNVIGGTYNPITDELSAKISGSGEFSVITNEKDFVDIKNSPAAVQNAIKKLATKGIIKGTSETEFSPDSSITRAEVAALIVRILSADDPNADGGFTDVTRSNWYFGAAGSSKKENVIEGYEDNTFRGTVVIPKVQIDAVIARTLKNRLGYLQPSVSVLDEFTDNANIPQWAKNDIALETYANMVIKRTDSSYEPNTEMTRGDAALVLEKLFDKVW